MKNVRFVSELLACYSGKEAGALASQRLDKRIPKTLYSHAWIFGFGSPGSPELMDDFKLGRGG
jgi:hypothetical protein